jgi:hypothetical protein
MYLERRCGGGTQDYRPFFLFFSSSRKFSSRSRYRILLCSRLHRSPKKTRVVLANPSEGVKKLYLRDDGTVRFCVHQAIDKQEWVPFKDNLSQHGQEVPLSVNPSSSTRTVFVLGQDAAPHSLKLHRR